MSERPKTKTRLPRASSGAFAGHTIMDRALAAEHGAAYVQLAAFAIDVDRVYAEASEQAALPFGWEVFLVECYLFGKLDPSREADRELLASTCEAVLAQPPDEQGYGSQILFAVHDALARFDYPPSLGALFARWRKAPKQLCAALDELFARDQQALRACAEHCLHAALEPPLSPPTRAALTAMREGRWLLLGRA